MSWYLSEMIKENEKVAEQRINEIYTKYNFNISKAKRNLTEITEEEAIKIGESFNSDNSPWIIQRSIDGNNFPYIIDKEGILLSSIQNCDFIEDVKTRKSHTIKRREYIFLFSNGDINPQCFTTIENCEKVEQYLCSIGIRRFDIYEKRLNKYLLKRLDKGVRYSTSILELKNSHNI